MSAPVRGSYVDVVATTDDTLQVTVNPLQLVEQFAALCSQDRTYLGAFDRLALALEMVRRAETPANVSHWERVASNATDVLRRAVYSSGAMTLTLDADEADGLRDALHDGLQDLVGISLQGVDDEPHHLDDLGARPVKDRS